MRLNSIFLLLLSALFLGSCEQEIGELTEYEPPRLIVNALITADADEQLLRIGMTGLLHTEHLPEAQVSMTRNGTSFLDETLLHQDSLLIPARDFQPGDRIGVEVRSGSLHAKASAEVPAPIIITGLDTLSVQSKRYKWSSEYERHTRYLVHLRLPEQTPVDQLQYFRAEIDKDVYTVRSYSLDGNIVNEVNLKTEDDHMQFGYWGDPALTETENADQENMSIQFEWLDGIQNIYHVFRSNYFEHGEYTLRLDLPEPYSYNPRLGMAQEVRIRIYAISRTEYNYLQALSALKTLDTGTLYDSEPGVTSNVVGGAGIFCVETVAEVSFFEDRNLLKVGENYYQRK